jgi:hypothetical protein
MKLLAGVLGLVLCHGLSFGQGGGYIGIFADPLGSSCEFEEAYPGVIQVYVVHVDAPEARAAQFMVAQSNKFTGAYLGEAMGFEGLAFGNSQTGLEVAYSTCVPSPIHILTISYYIDGTSDPCSYLEVVPDPSEDEILMIGCYSFDLIVLDVGGRMNFNVAAAADDCDCADPVAPVPVEKTTWGHVKALYQNASLR